MIPESKVGLDMRREFLVYTVIFVIAGGSLFDIITDREHWPFSPYPMFSWAKRDYSTTKLQLFGVTESKRPREIPLNDPQYIKPLDGVRLSPTLLRMEKSATKKIHLEAVLYEILVRYEVLRRNGRHNGPSIQGIRLYRYYWQFDPWTRNVNQPDRRELILEIMESPEK